GTAGRSSGTARISLARWAGAETPVATTIPISSEFRRGTTTRAPATTRSARVSGIAYVYGVATARGSATSAYSVMPAGASARGDAEPRTRGEGDLAVGDRGADERILGEQCGAVEVDDVDQGGEVRRRSDGERALHHAADHHHHPVRPRHVD